MGIALHFSQIFGSSRFGSQWGGKAQPLNPLIETGSKSEAKGLFG